MSDSQTRPARAAAFRAEGRTYRWIAAELGYDSLTEVVLDIDAWQSEQLGVDAAKVRAAEQARLAELGELPRHLTARLRGLDAPSGPRGTVTG